MLGGYELLRPLANGGMAEVWLARWRRWEAERMVVVKRILPQYAADPEFVAMFMQEVRLTALLHHPNVVQIVDAGESAGAPFLVLEWVRGVSLRRLLDAGGALDPAAAIAMAIDIAKGLEAAHEHDPAIVHRDVSPHNVLIDDAGFCKLSDFGIAKVAGLAQRTQAGVLKGKLAYLAPEQIEHGASGPLSDQYAFALTVYEALTGQRALAAATDVDLIAAARGATWNREHPAWQALHPDLQEIMARALAYDPAARWPNMRALRRQLQAFQARHLGVGPDATETLAVRTSALTRGDGDGAAVQATTTHALRPGAPSMRVRRPRQRWLYAAALAGAVGILWWKVPHTGGRNSAPRPASPVPASAFAAPLAASTATPASAQAVPFAAVARPAPLSGRHVPPLSPPSAPAAAPVAAVGTAAPPLSRPRVAAVARGSLGVQALPWARVRLDGRDIGTTPIAATAVTAGRHHIILEHPPSGWRRTLAVDIAADEHITILEAVETTVTP